MKVKNLSKIIISTLLLLLVVESTFAYGMHGKGYGKNQGGQVITTYDDTQINHNIIIDSYPIEELNEDEINGLLLMREEEKLARDVYLTLYDTWKQQIFTNIASSEQSHTDAIKLLLDRYNITDPMINDKRGIYENQELEELYNSLIETGNESLVSALIVGATVEDLDINDLNKLIANTDNQDIIAVYNNLNKGSRNHLRSFMKNLDRNNGEYEPQFISIEEFNSILSGEMETGVQYNSENSKNIVERNYQNLNNNNNNNVNNNNYHNSNSRQDLDNSNSNNQNIGKNQNLFQKMFSWFGFN